MNRFVVVVSFAGLGMGLEIVSSCLIPSTPPVPLCCVFSKKVALFPGLPWSSPVWGLEIVLELDY